VRPPGRVELLKKFRAEAALVVAHFRHPGEIVSAEVQLPGEPHCLELEITIKLCLEDAKSKRLECGVRGSPRNELAPGLLPDCELRDHSAKDEDTT